MLGNGGWRARCSSSQAAAAAAAVVVFARKTKKSAAAAVAAAEVAAGRTSAVATGVPYLSRPDQSCNRSVYTHFHKIWGLPPAPSSTPTLLTRCIFPGTSLVLTPTFVLSFFLSCFSFLCFLS